ncbi:hypothetical protein COW36_12235 [bacterium (Candidatus Blackallbacteria) CG17_big_fil_post_rev_8_21_14_2_50_48_46]|uniref:Fibronectin type-III domain-containing protein n=1 Tax=bacterium (Candidatus Blackallbacteria) CG17_big_fil_post_rev_8_21_14_2_50_48_46 TaxID=2014261 RepID=A0A2M7G3R6_9BACT|nr:MAG: hypothetical protein COW64_03025 [bacterium (Candidatus Blackallbacteria) CG18_big_fil_WC_8_21_14_2_50_49_26]PIW16528.1 MAG: hypothetical protein COW36_12235 [bacterium (Candidatus Blackallbacteria) CG17_big_fil_post_rev_8_21_14_2_50_48_46]PIW46036.1 MAG: hypothetical protein COW20_17500 [bacterium (Candidatus Blackallbacteria) CG13_big_fil_rev_8_21_14_2_50_49_14]
MKMKQSATRTLFLTTTLAAILSVSACGNPSSTSAPTPNTGNIPQLATQPTPQSSQLKKIRFSGHIFDSSTGENIEQAMIWIQSTDPAGPTPTASSGTTTPTPPPTTATPAASAATAAPAAPAATPAPPSTGATPPTAQPTPPPASSAPPLPIPPGTDSVPTPAPPNGLPQGLAPGEGWLWGVGAQAATPPKASNKETGIFRTTTNNQGKFWINDVPEGNYTVTVQAPKYRTLTLTQVGTGQLEIALSPLNPVQTTDMTGMVLSASDTPVARAHVSPSYFWGDSAGLPAQSNALGEYLLQEVPYGSHILAAFVMDEDYVIQKLGFSDEVSVTAKSIKSTSPVFAPASDSGVKLPSDPRTESEKRKELEDKVENILKETPAPEASPDETEPPVESPKPKAIPSPAPSASAPVQPKGTAAPNTPPEKDPVENEEEEKEKTFNLFSAVNELVTGKKAEDAESVKDGSVYPVITLHSVLSDFKIEGKVTVPPGFHYRGMEVYLTLKPAKDQRPQEVLLFTLPGKSPDSKASEDDESKKDSKKPTEKGTPPADPGQPEIQDFALRLPSLEKGQSYHFQFTAAAKEPGSLLYHHIYEIGEKNAKALEASFMPAPTAIEIEGEEDNAVPTSPQFAWEAVPGAEYYRILLEAGNAPDNKVVWEAWTKDTRIVYPLKTSNGRLKEGELYTVSVAALKGLKPALKNSKETYAHPGYQAIWTDLSTLTHSPFEVVKTEP